MCIDVPLLACKQCVFRGFRHIQPALLANKQWHNPIFDENQLRPIFNRIGIVEVQPSRSSHLNTKVGNRFRRDRIVRLGELKHKKDTIDVIKTLFGARK